MEAKPRHMRALTNWTALNDFLRVTTRVDDLRILEALEARRSPKPRKMFVERISGRKRVAELIAERKGRKMNLKDGAVDPWFGHWQKETPVNADFTKLGGKPPRKP